VSGADIAGMAGALGTVFAMVAFLAVVAWAWSRRRKADFDAAARLPLEEDADVKQQDGDKASGGSR
jgi:cytochrome c oxidase cbb3-type subunit 4